MANTIDAAVLRRREDERGDPPDHLSTTSVERDADVERKARAVANDRYGAFVSGGAVRASPKWTLQRITDFLSGKPNCDDALDTRSFDHDGCGSRPIAHPVLMVKEEGDADEIDRADVAEVMGDCFLMAPLAAMASIPEGRAILKSAISERTNDQGELVYTVTLHQRDIARPDRFVAVKVEVHGFYPVTGASPRMEDLAPKECVLEVWPCVIEKAYAQLKAGYNSIARGGDAAAAMEALAGRRAEQIELPSPLPGYWTLGGPDSLAFAEAPMTQYTPARLASDLAERRIVVLDTRDYLVQRPENYNLAPQHSYAVLGTEEKDGRLFVKLSDPKNYGPTDPLPVPFDQLHQWFRTVNVVSLK
jgi:hypothetical protein